MEINNLILKYRYELLVGIFGLLLIGIGIIWWMRDNTNYNRIEVIPSQVHQIMLTVDVSGEVVHPGVYSLPTGSRVGEAIASAGGILDSADHAWVSGSLNMAAKLIDGQKIFIPPLGSNPQLTKLININAASQAELETISGIGPATAQKILSDRPYQQLTELVTRKIIGQKLFEKIKDQISLW